MCVFMHKALQVAFVSVVRVPQGICLAHAFITQTVALAERKNELDIFVCLHPRLRGHNLILPLFAKVFAVALVMRDTLSPKLPAKQSSTFDASHSVIETGGHPKRTKPFLFINQ